MSRRMPDPLNTRIAEVWSEPLSDNERVLAIAAWARADDWAASPARRTSDARKWGNLVLGAYDGQAEALRTAREREEAYGVALRGFVEAWWEYDGPDFEPLDAAASNGMAVLGDVIALAPEQTDGTA